MANSPMGSRSASIVFDGAAATRLHTLTYEASVAEDIAKHSCCIIASSSSSIAMHVAVRVVVATMMRAQSMLPMLRSLFFGVRHRHCCVFDSVDLVVSKRGIMMHTMHSTELYCTPSGT